jgi:3-hydroxyisobutyrate dehydrogenase-like beta-hydroxyacid dehydrogenase
LAVPTPTQRDPIGLVGLGLLGLALAERALAASYEVLGFDLAPDRADLFAGLGGRPLASASEVAAACRRVLLVLPDDRVAGAVLEEIGPAVAPGTMILDVTTGDPESAAGQAAAAAAVGAEYLDATLSGSSAQARRGAALFMVGGPEPAFAACRALLAALGGAAVHVGPVGAGARMKLVTNLVLGLNRAALAEGMVFAAAQGLDPARALEVLRAGAAYSRIMDGKGDKMLHRDFTPEARLSQHLKDVRLILAAADAAGQPLPLSRAHRDLLCRAEGLGLGDADNSALLLALEALRGDEEQS